MLFAGILYVALLLTAVARGELEWKGFLAFALAGLLGLGLIIVFQLPLIWFTVVLVVLDLLLIFLVFRGHPELM